MNPEAIKQRILTCLELAVVFMCSVAVFVSFNPIMPDMGLDPSWRYAINQAVAQKLVFGKDIIFTFGPYASIYTNVYHPVTDSLVMAAAFCLAVGYGCMLAVLMSNIGFYRKLPWIILMLGLMGSKDALFFSYALLFNICIYRICFQDKNASLSSGRFVLMGIISMPLGLLPLVKSSLALAILPSLFAAAIYLAYFKKYTAAFSILLVFIVSLMVFWIAAGQPLSAIPQFIERSSQIISGYSWAMSYTTSSLDDLVKQLAGFVFSAVLIIGFVVSGKKIVADRLLLVFSYLVFLFAAWKAGFVRHDNDHALIAGNALLIGSLSLLFIDKGKIPRVALIVACFSGFYIGGNNILNPAYSDMLAGMNVRTIDRQALRESFDKKTDDIKKRANFPRLSGRSDIYSFQQSSLIASGNPWAPRPVLQSYSSYSPVLREMDIKYMEGSNRPDNIFFKLETIDSRFPTLDAGLYLSSLMNYYSVTDVVGNNDYILLKNDPYSRQNSPLKFLRSTTYGFGDDVKLPAMKGYLYVKIILYPTRLGRLANFFLNAPPVFISVVLNDGSQKKYRIIPAMAASGFMISPLIENNKDILDLMKNNEGIFVNKAVHSLSIVSSDSGFWFWKRDFTLGFSEQ